MNKSFECIENIAVVMADNCFGEFKFPDKIGKLEEEFAELMEQLTVCDVIDGKTDVRHLSESEIDRQKAKDEMSDVLFVLLHMSNKMGFTGSDLLHHAAGKMFNRIKDPNYNKS